MKRFLVTYIIKRSLNDQSFYTHTISLNKRDYSTDVENIMVELTTNPNYSSKYEELVLLNFWEIK